MSVVRPLQIIGYFILGLLWDGLVCLDVIATAHGLWFLAGISTIILTVLAFEVYDKLVSRGLKRGCILSLALGSSVGTMIAVRFLDIY